jgi:hypothetical protein
MSGALIRTRSDHVVWANLRVSRESQREIHNFFVQRIGLNRSNLQSDLHITVYHARRQLVGLVECDEAIHIEIDPMDFRFMTMTPGGENPRPDVDPSTCPIGVRIRRTTPATSLVREFRAKFYPHETPKVLGLRPPSTHTRSAFGARYFQPHITLLKSGTGIDSKLSLVGELFRASIPPVRLDRFIVKCRSRKAD